MMLRLCFDLPDAAKAVEDAVDSVIAGGARTPRPRPRRRSGRSRRRRWGRG